MLRLRRSLWLALAALPAASASAEQKPDFSGVWKRTGPDPQIMIIAQNETGLRVFEFVGDRLAIAGGPIDGKPHSQIVDGAACDFLARWERDSLVFEIKRHPAGPTGSEVDVRHLLRLAANHKSMAGTRTGVAPPSGAIPEKWENQDPPAQAAFQSGFDDRLKLDDPTASAGVDGNRLRARVAYAFNDVTAAEREYLAIIDQKPASKFRDEARRNLARIYERNGMLQKALPYWGLFDRFLYKKLAKYPEISVAHRGYARIHVTRDADGRILLPVSAAGKDSSFMLDTGTNNSLIRMSEAVRLGLKPEGVHRRITNGSIHYDATLTIVPAFVVGATRLENVPLWIVPDARIAWPGIAGIDLLLKLETLRWDTAGEGEIGFPPQGKNIRDANLCFTDDDVLADVSRNGQAHVALHLDTGNNTVEFYAPFLIRNLDLLSAGSRPSFYQWNSQGARGEYRELTFPEVTLTFGGMDFTLRQAGVLLEKRYEHGNVRGASGLDFNRLNGVVAMDVLNAAHRVTLDFPAMRVTFE